jgi:amidase
MPTGPDVPSAAMLTQIAADYGIDLTAAEADSYRSLMAGAINSYRRLEDFAEPKPDVKYRRDGGWRPKSDDNPCNGWYWRCNIAGAASGLLAGQRVAVKDVVSIAGIPMTIGSSLLEGFIPDFDATIVTRILDAGGTIVGTTNCEAFAFSGAGHTCDQGPVRNPHNPAHNPGGSSSGSAVVLATGQADVAIGGDQGGSIRLPASWSGVLGLKPTFGLVPYTGCAMIEATLDHIGPMATTAEGIARLLSAIAGSDPLDPRQRGAIPRDLVTDYMPALRRGVNGLKVALIKEGFAQSGEDTGLPPSDPEVDRRVAAAARKLATLGATVEEISLPMHLDAFHIWNGVVTEGAADYVMRGAGLGTNWQGFYNTALAQALAHGVKARPNDLPAPAKLVLLIGEYMRREYPGRYYGKAQNLRPLATAAYDSALARYDILAMPTIPFTATRMVGRDASIEDNVGTALNMLRNVCVANLTGHPAISIPCGMHAGLPVGLMLTGRHFDDGTLIAAAAAFESLGDWKRM